jgi:hypothetical protein
MCTVQDLMGETKGNRQLERSGHRRKEIKIYVKETRWRGEGRRRLDPYT